MTFYFGEIHLSSKEVVKRTFELREAAKALTIDPGNMPMVLGNDLGDAMRFHRYYHWLYNKMSQFVEEDFDTWVEAVGQKEIES